MSAVEFHSVEQLQAHYKAVQARLNRGRPPAKTERLPRQVIISKYYTNTYRNERWEPFITPVPTKSQMPPKKTMCTKTVFAREPWRDVLAMPYGASWENRETYAYDDKTRELIRAYRCVNPIKSMERVTYEIARQFNVTVADIMGRQRTMQIAKARQQAMFWAHVASNRSYANIARYFNRDHTTVLHAMAMVRRLPEFELWIEELKMGASLRW